MPLVVALENAVYIGCNSTCAYHPRPRGTPEDKAWHWSADQVCWIAKVRLNGAGGAPCFETVRVGKLERGVLFPARCDTPRNTDRLTEWCGHLLFAITS